MRFATPILVPGLVFAGIPRALSALPSFRAPGLPAVSGLTTIRFLGRRRAARQKAAVLRVRRPLAPVNRAGHAVQTGAGLQSVPHRLIVGRTTLVVERWSDGSPYHATVTAEDGDRCQDV